ncbi:MAG: rRNA maturation RNase YbeY [Lachnospiraceae bacterium]|nr:rRNA maturation RNase YbeY [Lachnospiraceae bacterium]
MESLLGLDTRALIHEVSEEALKQEGCPWEVMFDVLMTGDEEIRVINNENRGIDRPTDVLSFPMIDFDEPGDFSICEDPSCAADFFDPETGELVLGSIVLSVPRILEQAREYGHSVKREFAFLVAHSMFHLMGYDHMTEAEEDVMKKKQYAVLDELGIVR